MIFLPVLVDHLDSLWDGLGVEKVTKIEAGGAGWLGKSK